MAQQGRHRLLLLRVQPLGRGGSNSLVHGRRSQGLGETGLGAGRELL